MNNKVTFVCPQYSLIAAYLNPVDRDGWIRLAELSLELQDKQQAIICYSKGTDTNVFRPYF
jgi:hypothetical protein